MKYLTIFIGGLIAGIIIGAVGMSALQPTKTKTERITDAKEILKEQLDSLGIDTMSIHSKADLLERWAREKRGENR